MGLALTFSFPIRCKYDICLEEGWRAPHVCGLPSPE